MRIWLIVLIAGLVIFTSCAPSVTQVGPAAAAKLRIVTEEFPPYNFIDKDKNVTGQSTEIVKAIMQSLGVEAKIEVVPLAEGLQMAQQSNTAIFSLNKTTQRENLYKWVGPIGHYSQAFYAKKGTNIPLNKLEDAKTAGLIGVYKGDAGNQFLVSQGFINLNESQDDVGALQKLMKNEIQLWLGNQDGLEIIARKANVDPADLQVMPIVAISADLYIAFSKDVPDSTIAAWQKAADTLMKERDSHGKTFYDKLHAKYGDSYYVLSLVQ